MAYYLAIGRNEILIHSTTQENLENIMLHERSQLQKITYDCIYIVYRREVYSNRKRACGYIVLVGREEWG